MTVTITLKGALLTILALLGMVLLIYIIALVRKLIGTLKRVDEILGDTKTMTEVASQRVQQVDGIVDGLEDTVTVMVDAVKGNQSIVEALTHIVDATSSFIGIIRGKREGDGKKAEKKKGK